MSEARLPSPRRTRQRNKGAILELRFGTWNVRTMLREGAENNIAEELNKYTLDVLALQEIRWKGTGRIEKPRYRIYYSGYKEKQKKGLYGVGFIISERIKKSVLRFTPVSNRICYMRIKGRFHNITFVNVHAPINDAEDYVADSFYDELQNICERAPAHDAVIVLGDFNAQLGREEYFADLFGRHSLHENTNNNGIRVAQFAASYNFKVMSTWFPRKNIYKGTWMVPKTKDINQIDHVLISKRWATAIENVRSYRGVNYKSDHYLVGAIMRQKIACAVNVQSRRTMRWNVEKLKDERVKQEYEENINRKLQEYGNGNNIDEEWTHIRNAIVEAANQSIGKIGIARNKEWFDDECKMVVEQKRLARMKCLQQDTLANANNYKEKRVASYRLCRRKKRETLKSNVEDMVEYYSKNESRKLYKKLKDTVGEFRPKINACKDDKGVLLTEREKIMHRWKGYFENILKGDQTETRVIEYQTAELWIDEPNYFEIEQVIKYLNYNASGSDGIIAELLKCGGELLWKRIYDLILIIWNEERIPEEWKLCIIQPVYKKGDKLVCSNYRGVTFLNVTYKVFSNFINKRLTTYAENIIGDYQCGFRPNRSTTDHVFTLRQIQEKTYEYNINMHNLYVNFKQAFDSLNRRKMLNDLYLLGVPGKYIRLVEATLSGTRAVVRVDGEITTSFSINAGVRQGGTLSTTLFNLALEAVIRKLKITWSPLEGVYAYADEVAIISESERRLREIMANLDGEAQEKGLKINEDKTKYMKVQRNMYDNQNLDVGSYIFKHVQNITYLGSQMNQTNIVSNENQSNKNPIASNEIKFRIERGSRCYYAHKKLIKSKILNRQLKLTVYKSLIRPVVTYGCEAWTLYNEDNKTLIAFERKILREIFGPVQNDDKSWRIRTNIELDHLMQGTDIIRFIKSRRLEWLGHVERNNGIYQEERKIPGRMEDTRITKKIFHWEPQGKRPRGKPKKRWLDDVGGSEDNESKNMETTV